jgi:hypothetical protein
MYYGDIDGYRVTAGVSAFLQDAVRGVVVFGRSAGLQAGDLNLCQLYVSLVKKY